MSVFAIIPLPYWLIVCRKQVDLTSTYMYMHIHTTFEFTCLSGWDTLLTLPWFVCMIWPKQPSCLGSLAKCVVSSNPIRDSQFFLKNDCFKCIAFLCCVALPCICIYIMPFNLSSPLGWKHCMCMHTCAKIMLCVKWIQLFFEKLVLCCLVSCFVYHILWMTPVGHFTAWPIEWARN